MSQMKSFTGTSDIFKGLTIDATSFTYPPSTFAEMLKYSIEEYKSHGIRGLWIKIPIQRSDYIPHCVEFGFKFHHAKPDYVMMTRWLPKDEPNMIPKYGNTYLGVGAAVIDFEKKEILLIKERWEHISYSGNRGWKVPGGAVDPQEKIGDAAVREVFEETGIKSEFIGILTFRHLLNYKFGAGDLYFGCLLKAVTKDIKVDKNEIDECKWIPLDEYFSLKDLRPVQIAIQKAVKEYFQSKAILKSTDLDYKDYQATMYHVHE